MTEITRLSMKSCCQGAMCVSVLRIVIFVIAFVLLLLLSPLWAATQFGTTLDISWQIVLNHAFVEGWQFGKDIVFTYGPLGFLTQAGSLPLFFPDTYPWHLGAVITRCLLLAGILAWALPHRFRCPIWSLMWLGAFFGLAFHPNFQYFVYPPLMAIAYATLPEGRVRTALLWGMAAWLACMSLGKLSYLMLSASMIMLLTVHHVWLRRRVPGLAIVYISALLVLWMVAGQDLSNLPAYFWNSIPVATGYGAAMGFPAPPLASVYYWALGLAVVAAIGLLTWNDRRRAVVLIIAFSFALLIIYKAYFARYVPERVDYALRYINVLALLTWLSAVTDVTRWQHRIAGGLLILVFAAPFLFKPELSTAVSQKTVAQEFRLNEMKLRYSRGARGLMNWSETVEKQRADSARQRNQVAAQYAGLKPDGSTMDVYSAFAAIAIAGDWVYRPRPVFQSYTAYTEKLLRLNADHLRSDHAAETIIIDWTPIDDRLTAMEDSLSWPELLTRYQFNGRFRTGKRIALKLKKRQHPLGYKLEPISIIEGRLGETVTLPEADRLWAPVA